MLEDLQMINKLIKENIQAVHEQDLEKILEGLDLLDKFKHGELKCNFCRSRITFDNLHSFFPQSGDIKFVCTNSNCFRKLSKLLREGKVSL